MSVRIDITISQVFSYKYVLMIQLILLFIQMTTYIDWSYWKHFLPQNLRKGGGQAPLNPSRGAKVPLLVTAFDGSWARIISLYLQKDSARFVQFYVYVQWSLSIWNFWSSDIECTLKHVYLLDNFQPFQLELKFQNQLEHFMV